MTAEMSANVKMVGMAVTVQSVALVLGLMDLEMFVELARVIQLMGHAAVPLAIREVVHHRFVYLLLKLRVYRVLE